MTYLVTLLSALALTAAVGTASLLVATWPVIARRLTVRRRPAPRRAQVSSCAAIPPGPRGLTYHR